MRADQFYHDVIVEDSIESVGREFQHIEDLVYIYGTAGIKRAIERLESIGKDSKHLEVKWDGSPAIIFGRDEQGRFHLGDKFHKELNVSPDQVKNSYLGRSKGEVSKERMIFVNSMAELYSLYEAATPKDFRGFIEGGLLYKTTPPLVKGEYVFQPNTVIYHVNADTPLGKRIGASISGAAATAYFDDLPGRGGNRITDNLSQVIQGIGSQQVVIVPPKYATEVSAQIPKEKIDKIKSFANQAASKIEQFITPDAEWVATYPDQQTATKKWREVIYKYVNSQVDVPGGLESLGGNMAQWAETDPILTKGRRQLAIDKIKKDQSGLNATFLLVRSIMHLKDSIVDQMENKTLGSMGIRAELPGGVTGGEGFVSDPAGGSQPLKLVKRGTFTAANRQQGRTSLKEYDKSNNSKTAVVGWGRGMGHSGHMYLAESVISYAKKIGATPFFYVSETMGKDDPLDPATKLDIYRTVFPEYAEIFRTAKAPVPLLQSLYEDGYTDVVFMVGEDQRESFQFLTKPTKSTGQLPVPFDSIKVMSRQESGSKTANMAGPRATPMRDVLKDTDIDYEEKFKVWRDAMPKQLSDKHVEQLMNQAAKAMNIKLTQSVSEASYPGNMGMMEVMKFYKIATPRQQELFKKLLDKKEMSKAWKLIQMVSKVKLQGKEFNSDVAEAQIPPQGALMSPIPGTPADLLPQPTKRQLMKRAKNQASIKKFMGR